MKSSDRSRDSAHQECWELLPWFVNGTLNESQVRQVEAHLVDCADCRDEMANQSLLRQLMRSDEGVLHAPHASLHKVLAQIDRTEDASPVEPASPTRRPHRMDKSRWLAIAVVAEAACLIVLIGTLSWKLSAERAAPRYSTLTSESATPAQAAARIVFAPAVSVAELNDLLHSFDARIVAGPTETGVFTVTLPSTLSEAEVAAAIERMQQDGRVRFAQPARGSGTRQ
jgi:hypothetical protein